MGSRSGRRAVLACLAVSAAMGFGPAAASADDILSANESQVKNGFCVGLNCLDDENLGVDDLRVRQDNPRIHIADSTDQAINPDRPTRDWRFVANHNPVTVGEDGVAVFEIDDAGNDGSLANSVFRLFAGAPENAMVVGSTGDVGLGEADPERELHLFDGDTPTVRLEQGGTAFGSQTWDIGGNEANFFVRDQSNPVSPRLVFRLRPGAPTSSIDVNANGNVGVGDSSPDAALDLQREDGTAQLRVDETGGTGRQTLLDLDGKTSALARFAQEGPDGSQWLAGLAESGDFTFSTGDAAATKVTLSRGGDVTAGGGVSAQGSIRQLGTAASQADASAVDESQLMTQLRSLPINRYSGPGGPGGQVHVGPTAEGFFNAFGFGDAQYTALADMSGVALAAIKDLDRRVTKLDGGTDVAALEARVADAEASVAKAKRRATKALRQVRKLKRG
jgi:hypothetical protein